MNSTSRIVKQGPDDVLEIRLIDPIDFGRDLERHTTAFGDLDGTVWPLLGADSAEKGEIAAACALPTE